LPSKLTERSSLHSRRAICRRHGRLHAADVVRDPRLKIAGSRARIEGERQALQVPVDAVAQVSQNALTELVGDERLVDAERTSRDRDHHRAEGDEQGDAGARAATGEERVVKDDLNQ
jgi:hypothetical protein